MKKSSTRAWLSLLCCLLANLIYCGFINNQMALLLDPICTALNFPRALFSSLQSLTPIVNAIISMFFMKFMNKLGLRRMAIIGGIAIVSFTVLYYLAGKVPSAAVVFIGLAQIILAFNMSWATAMTANIVITNWFAKSTGTLISLYAAAGGIGGVIAAPLVGKWVASVGWQTTMFYFIIASAATLLIFILLFKAAPGQNECRVWEGEGSDEAAGEVVGLTYAQAKKTPNFLFCAFLCVGLGVFMYPPMMTLAAYCSDVGLVEIAGVAMSVVFAAQIIVNLPLGALVEKIGLKATMIPIFLAFLAAMLALALAPSKGVIFFAAVCVGAAFAVINVLTALLIGEIFGNRDFAGIQAKFYVFMIVGMIIGPPIFNAVYDLAGSYKPVFIANACAMVLMILAMFAATKKIDFSKYSD